MGTSVERTAYLKARGILSRNNHPALLRKKIVSFHEGYKRIENDFKGWAKGLRHRDQG